MKRPIRVLHIIESLRAGGKERQLSELLTALSSVPEVENELAVMSDDIHYERIPQIPLHKLIRRSRHDPAIAWHLHRLVRMTKPDIVHSWGSMCTVYAAPVTSLNRIKLLNGQIRDAPQDLTLLNREYCRVRATLPFSNVVVANSNAGLEAYRISGSKGVCIYNGFDFSRTAHLLDPRAVRQELGITTPHIVGMVATFSDFKDYDAFFKSARSLMNQRDDITFVTVGDGPNLPRFRDKWAGHPRVRLLGTRKNVEDVANAFSVGVLITNARTHGEGISNAIMEYMALAKPVIATKTGGTPEIVSEGSTGFLVSDGDVAAIAARLEAVLDEPDFATKLGQAGRRTIKSRFSVQAMKDAYVSLYFRLSAHREG